MTSCVPTDNEFETTNRNRVLLNIGIYGWEYWFRKSRTSLRKRQRTGMQELSSPLTQVTVHPNTRHSDDYCLSLSTSLVSLLDLQWVVSNSTPKERKSIVLVIYKNVGSSRLTGKECKDTQTVTTRSLWVVNRVINVVKLYHQLFVKNYNLLNINKV